MGNTSDRRVTGRDPFQPPSFTPGPLGINDAGEPFSVVTGDTPGPAGTGGDRAQELALDPGTSLTPDGGIVTPPGSKLTVSDTSTSSAAADAKATDKATKLASLIAAQDDVMSDESLQPSGTTTHCSAATLRVAKATGVEWDGILGNKDGNFTANDQIANLAKAVKEKKYKEVTPDEAQTLANQGITVFATQAKPGGHGHVATCRPEGAAGDSPQTPYKKPLLANVGAQVGVKGYLAERGKTWGVFFQGTNDQPVVFYAPAK
ncbi:MAG TPA: hypothetical protein VMU05_21045 [Dongiaceae bacterium]|nr:hypothetical protein [Dongiaceae bacterium]